MNQLTMAPDRFFRFHKAAEWVHAIAGSLKQRVFILDVGAREQALAPYLTDYTLIETDLLPPETPSDFVVSRLPELPFQSACIPIVTCLDVFEHIPSDERISALKELMRVSAGAIVLAYPHQNPLSTRCENALAAIHEAVHSEPCGFLREHSQFGLVDTSPLLETVRESFPHTHVEYSFPINQWFMSHTLDYVLALLPQSRLIHDAVNTWINQSPDSPTTRETAYRTYLIASRSPLPLPAPAEPPARAAAPPPPDHLPDAFKAITDILEKASHYTRKLESELTASTTGYKTLENSYRKLEESHRSLEQHSETLQNEINLLAKHSRHLEETLVSQNEALREHEAERAYLLKVRAEYEKTCKTLAELESYVHIIENVSRSKDKTVIELQEKLTELIVKMALRNGSV